VHGPSKLARALPTWNRLSPAAHMKDARPREAPGPVTSTRETTGMIA
jgi:hypothetical protein